jgi:diguanylate cyclase (GGDEF)-like protein
MDGLQICAEFKSNPALRDIPVIFLTSMVNTASEIEGLQSGAVDYVKKPIQKEVLKARIRLHLARRQQEHQLTRLAQTDGLTGLANRAHFDQQLGAEIMRLSRLSLPLSLILLDVDFFKQYNDIYGHVGGDDCLRLVSSTIGVHINRLSDLAARVGGEEFACILPQTELAGAMVIAERIRQSVMGLKVPHQGSTVAECVTVSIGVVSESCDRIVTPQMLMMAADAQLYRAKRNGRNQVCAAGQENAAP